MRAFDARTHDGKHEPATRRLACDAVGRGLVGIFALHGTSCMHAIMSEVEIYAVSVNAAVHFQGQARRCRIISAEYS